MSDKIKSADKGETKHPENSRGRAIPKPQVNIVPEVDQGIFGIQTAGNQAVQRMIQGAGGRSQGSGIRLQAKLTIGQPNDPYEQEADRVAEQVMRMPVGSEQLTVGSGQVSGVGREDVSIQRMCAECEEESAEENLLHRKEHTGDKPKMTSGVESRINHLRGKGSPLSP